MLMATLLHCEMFKFVNTSLFSFEKQAQCFNREIKSSRDFEILQARTNNTIIGFFNKRSKELISVVSVKAAPVTVEGEYGE